MSWIEPRQKFSDAGRFLTAFNISGYQITDLNAIPDLFNVLNGGSGSQSGTNFDRGWKAHLVQPVINPVSYAGVILLKKSGWLLSVK